MEPYEQILPMLPEKLRQAAASVSQQWRHNAEELRLRLGQPAVLSDGEEELPLPDSPETDSELLYQVLERATGASIHSYLPQLKQGYLTVNGGHRIGVCGELEIRQGEVHNLRSVTSLNVRIAREVNGCAAACISQLVGRGGLRNTLILAPPGVGKTTFLRDVIRCLSNGVGTQSMRIGVADERGELSGYAGGKCHLELGRRTDFLIGGKKAQMAVQLLRGMNPQVIAMDEITEREDLRAMEEICGCGVSLLATAHATGVEEMRSRSLYAALLDKGLFSQAVILSREGKRRRSCLVKLEMPC